MKNHALALLASMLIFNFSSPAQDPWEVMAHYAEIVSNSTCIDYDVRLLKKYGSRDDTLDYSGHLRLIYQAEDTVSACHVKLFLAPYYTHLYNGKATYFYNDSLKYASKNPEPHISSWMNGNAIGNLISKAIFKPLTREILEKYQAELSYIPSPEGHQVRIVYPPEEDLDYQENTYWFNDDYEIIGMESKIGFFGMHQYSRYTFSNISRSTSPCPAESFEPRNLDSTSWTLEVDEPIDPNNLQSFPEDFFAPEWELPIFLGKSLKSENLLGKVVLIDFWYIGCYWCIKSMPAIEALYDKYRKKGFIVLGFNGTDGKDPAKLKRFLMENKVKYPTILADDETLGAFMISAYPTFILIDKQGVVRKNISGYGPDVQAELESMIQQLLKE